MKERTNRFQRGFRGVTKAGNHKIKKLKTGVQSKIENSANQLIKTIESVQENFSQVKIKKPRTF
jgi:HD superfamily phosphohydrolase YqeK